MLARLRRLNYRHLIPDICLITVSLYGSLYLRVGWEGLHQFLGRLNSHFLIFLSIRMATFITLGVYDIIWRYVSLKDALVLVKGIMASSVIIIAASYVVDIGRLPRATFFIDTVLLILLLGGVRFARRLFYEYTSDRAVRQSGKRIVIYGAGTNGRTLAHRFNTDTHVKFKLMGFIDDDPAKVGRVVAGHKVLGTLNDLPTILKNYEIQEVIVAITKPSGSILRQVVQTCRSYQIRPRMVSSLSQLSQKTKGIEIFRDIGLNDLLNRSQRHVDVTAIRELIQNKKVLVTGAGGTIGSELSRQILDFNPRQLLLLDHSEYNLYKIDQELRIASKERSLTQPLLADIKDMNILRDVFVKFRPDIVFHAAAYKHVHLVENNPYSSILNNVLGTQNLLKLSDQYGVERFVLISTDKAVNPAGIMGATKRVCELMVDEFGEKTDRRYCAVRFGNVLGSSGSLIPLLKRQIENNEPLTITHKEVTRYFMLIPEAVALVLRAATIAAPGDITILRMGGPIKIVDLAKSLRAMMGKSENEVPIIYTGLRPGEKISEELYLCGDELNTEDPDILVLPKGDDLGPRERESLENSVQKMLEAAQNGSQEAISILGELVKFNYKPIEGADETSYMLLGEAGLKPYDKGDSASPVNLP